MTGRGRTSLGLAFTLALAGCATQTGWAPTVDPHNDPNANRISADMAECQRLAQHASGGTGTETLKGAAVGGLIGAAAGAAIGAAVGNAGQGAAIGAATGGIGGAAHKGYGAEDTYQRAYRECMRGRGHNVIN